MEYRKGDGHKSASRGNPLYLMSIIQSAMYKNTENITARRTIGIYYFTGQRACMDVLLYEISQADAEEFTIDLRKQPEFYEQS